MKFLVILYVNRSGSTLLSRMLSDETNSICVFPEVAFLVGLLEAKRAGSRVAGASLFELICADVRSEALQLDDDILRQICMQNSSENLEKLFIDLATARMGALPEMIAFKLNGLISYIPDLTDSFAELSVLHIFRDPRAVVNSMLRSEVPEKPGFNMARGSAVSAAREWRAYVRRIDEIESSGSKIISLRYEDINTVEKTGFVELMSRLDIDTQIGSNKVQQGPRYSLAALDREIHPLVFKPFQAERMQAWETELAAGDIIAVEQTCFEDMRLRSYVPTGPNRLGLPYQFYLHIRFWGATILHYLRTIWFHATKKGGIRYVAKRASHIVRTR